MRTLLGKTPNLKYSFSPLSLLFWSDIHPTSLLPLFESHKSFKNLRRTTTVVFREFEILFEEPTRTNANARTKRKLYVHTNKKADFTEARITTRQVKPKADLRAAHYLSLLIIVCQTICRYGQQTSIGNGQVSFQLLSKRDIFKSLLVATDCCQMNTNRVLVLTYYNI